MVARLEDEDVTVDGAGRAEMLHALRRRDAARTRGDRTGEDEATGDVLGVLGPVFGVWRADDEDETWRLYPYGDMTAGPLDDPPQPQ